jgi:hypothetical protein
MSYFGDEYINFYLIFYDSLCGWEKNGITSDILHNMGSKGALS